MLVTAEEVSSRESVETGIEVLVFDKPPVRVGVTGSVVREGDSSALIAVVVSTGGGLPPRSRLKSSIVSGVTWLEMKIESTRMEEAPAPEHVSEIANVGKSDAASTCPSTLIHEALRLEAG